MTATYVEDYEALASNAGAKAGWLKALRASGLERFQASGFPNQREEDWRFIDLAPVTGKNFRLADSARSTVRAADIAPYLFEIPGVRTLVFVNGAFVPSLSNLSDLPPGVTVSHLAGVLATDPEKVSPHLGRYAKQEANGFTALNTAFVRDGLFVRVGPGADAGAPIHAVFVSDGRADGAATYPRSLVLVERGGRASVIESYVGLTENSYFTNVVTEAVVAEGGHLEHIKIQRESPNAYHIGTTHLHQARDSRGVSHAISFGAALCRNNLDVVLDGPGVEAQMFGFYMGRGTQEVDNHTYLLHAHPNCSTREVYKGILDGRAHGVFNGKIYVTPLAQKTDAKQTNRALLLSDHAKIDTKPQLEIFADDVKCTHGATVGRLDPMAAFYLKSRGIGGDLARKILTYAFAAEVLEEIPFAPVRAGLEAVVMEWLERAEGTR